MAQGFPDGNFRIINADTGLCLVALFGGMSGGIGQERDRLTGELVDVPYQHTKDQVLGVAKPKGDKGELWFLDNNKNSWGYELWHLVNLNKDIRSWYNLYAWDRNFGSGACELELVGRGTPNQNQWEARPRAGTGLFDFLPVPQGEGKKLVGLAGNGDGTYTAVLDDEGAPHQLWRFEVA
ncbi:hypothetical protein ACIRRA_25885 [Nocardia sp. NPDC101769]|uniref:hypothetical protein n=1 Tax=Nocardia sp. NPDC101769 TaxID=3364333 RepID=UPI0038008180